MSAATMSKEDDADDTFRFRYAQPSRSAEFWFEDGSAVIEVENTLYNVHRSILKRQSNFFRESLPGQFCTFNTISGTSPAGTLQQPLALGVTKLDFELLLQLIYPSDYWSQHSFTVAQWLRIARVATVLEFPSVRKAALENIFEDCGAVELISLGKKHDVPECISSGFRILCLAEEPLSLADGYTIGMELVIQIARARELLAKGCKWSDIELDFVF